MNIYTDHQGLHNFNIKQNLNSIAASWYLRMSEFIHHIHYRPGFKIGKPDGLSRRSGEEVSGMDAHLFDEGQLLDLENDDVGEEEDAEHVELEGIDLAK